MNSWFDDLSAVPNGLALGGGGAKGCYEIGVWKALREQGIRFERVSGTSIGALVGAMYVQDSLDSMIEFVQTIRPDAIAEDLFAFPENLGKWVSERKEISGFLNKYIFSRTGMDISPLKDVIARLFNYQVFEASPVNFACMTFNLTRRRPEAYFKDEMNAENAAQIILASASCYPAFPVMKMNGNEYIDGGYWDNIPVDLAEKMGAKKVLAINVEGPGLVLPVNKEIDTFTIRPMIQLGSFLDFSKDSCMRALNAGELEMGKLLGRWCGHFYTFDLNDEGNLEFWNGYLEFMFSIARVSIAPKDIETFNQWACGYTPSTLSKTLCGGQTLFELVEDLAFFAGLDPVKVWNLQDFLNTLMDVLGDIHARPFTAIDSADVDRRMMHISMIHASLLRNGLETVFHRGASGLSPAEYALALVWQMLESALRPVKEENEDSTEAGKSTENEANADHPAQAETDKTNH
ncbi:patatin-like phospholipase family protein [Allobaculum mucilyticum]|uniref:patatin-like phospholipase family protein n=1 Tax=Allobaculum mucilyticum TaxID=2834459 RepID=UPI001E5BCEB0|nr:patatin-like phospholipase family protein [Allobaculum mucilyticum]UNT95833.1 patatin-like phospholipase family protein [Allobaculum mucilyticum]